MRIHQTSKYRPEHEHETAKQVMPTSTSNLQLIVETQVQQGTVGFDVTVVINWAQ